MARLTIPNANASFGQCPHCKADIKCNEVWYGKLTEWLQKTNQDSLSTDGRLVVSATSNTNLQFAYRGTDDVVRTANLTLTP